MGTNTLSPKDIFEWLALRIVWNSIIRLWTPLRKKSLEALLRVAHALQSWPLYTKTYFTQKPEPWDQLQSREFFHYIGKLLSKHERYSLTQAALEYSNSVAACNTRWSWKPMETKLEIDSCQGSSRLCKSVKNSASSLEEAQDHCSTEVNDMREIRSVMETGTKDVCRGKHGPHIHLGIMQTTYCRAMINLKAIDQLKIKLQSLPELMYTVGMGNNPKKWGERMMSESWNDVRRDQ